MRRDGPTMLIIEKAVAGRLNMQKRGCTVSIREGVLYSYEMPIAARCDDEIMLIVNRDDLPSTVTVRHSNACGRLAQRYVLNVQYVTSEFMQEFMKGLE